VKARVHVFYKDGVFDPQGNTVAGSLKKIGFSKVKDVRMGKVIDLDLSYSSTDEARIEIKKMCDKLLVNPVIESFQYEILEK